MVYPVLLRDKCQEYRS